VTNYPATVVTLADHLNLILLFLNMMPRVTIIRWFLIHMFALHTYYSFYQIECASMMNMY